jgi:hypothetical protein
VGVIFLFRQHHQVWLGVDIDEVRVSLEIIGCVIDLQCAMLVYPAVGINGQVKYILFGELMNFLFKQLREQIS